MASIYDMGVGNTPMIQLHPDERGNTLFLKMESQNYIGHSSKARSVAQMLIDHDNSLRGKTIVESSSGNTVLALAEFGELLGYKTVAVVEHSIPTAKLNHLIKCGVEIEMVNPPPGCDGRTMRKDRVQQLRNHTNYVWLNQYENTSCVRAHEYTTANEIIEQTSTNLDFLVAPIGTGGTIVGTSKGIKTKLPNVKTIAVEPHGSCIFGGHPSAYKNFGAGNDRSVFYEHDVFSIDSHLSVPDSTTIENAISFYENTGIPIGLSAAMAYEAVKYLFHFYSNKRAVLIVPDSLENYFDLTTLTA